MNKAMMKTLCVLPFVVPAVVFGEANPYSKANDAWISIDGTVESVAADSFRLDYGSPTSSIGLPMPTALPIW